MTHYTLIHYVLMHNTLNRVVYEVFEVMLSFNIGV